MNEYLTCDNFDLPDYKRIISLKENILDFERELDYL